MSSTPRMTKGRAPAAEAKPEASVKSEAPAAAKAAAAKPASTEAEPAPDAGKPGGLRPLAERLPEMSDRQLVGLQASAQRISRTQGHVKRGSAAKALPLIEAEISRRAASLS